VPCRPSPERPAGFAMFVPAEGEPGYELST